MPCKYGCVIGCHTATVSIGKPDYSALYLTAEGQRGYFTTRQAREAGIRDRLLTHWVKDGRFQRIAHGIYRLRDFPVTPREELMIPLLWAGPVSALSHDTALELYGISDVLPTTTHLTIPTRFRPRLRAGMTLHFEPLSSDEVVLREDLRLTTLERTLVDCFRWGTDRDQLRIAARQAVDNGLVSSRRLSAALDKAGITRHIDPLLHPETSG